MKIILKTVILCCIVSQFASCELDKIISCNSGSFKEFIRADDFDNLSFSEKTSLLNDQTVYFHYNSLGEANFCFGKSFTELCPDVPAKVSFEVHTTSELQPVLMELTAISQSTLETHSSFSGSTQFLFISDQSMGPSVILKDSMEVDFKELFDVRSANMNVYLEISFPSLNSFQEDSLYFVEHIKSILLTLEADRY